MVEDSKKDTTDLVVPSPQEQQELLLKILKHINQTYAPSSKEQAEQELTTAEILCMFEDSYNVDLVDIHLLSLALETAGFTSYLQTDFEDPRMVWGLKMKV